jgi:hypothetical protein
VLQHVRLAIARGLSGLGLAMALWLFSMNWSYTGPAYLSMHLFLVGGAAGISRALRRGEDGVSSACNVLALAMPLAGFHLERAGDCEPGALACLAGAMLGRGWVVCLPLCALIAIALFRRRPALAPLGPARAVDTCAVAVSAPVVFLTGAVFVAPEFMNGGAALFVVYPLVMAALATARAWIVGRPSPTARALRRGAPPAALLGIAAATIASLARREDAGPIGHDVELVSLGRLGWALALFAVAVFFARDPGGAVKPSLGDLRDPAAA